MTDCGAGFKPALPRLHRSRQEACTTNNSILLLLLLILIPEQDIRCSAPSSLRTRLGGDLVSCLVVSLSPCPLVPLSLLPSARPASYTRPVYFELTYHYEVSFRDQDTLLCYDVNAKYQSGHHEFILRRRSDETRPRGVNWLFKQKK